MDMGCCSFTRYAIVRQQLSDDRITRETLSYNNPYPSSPSSTIYIYIIAVAKYSPPKKNKNKIKIKKIIIYIYIGKD